MIPGEQVSAEAEAIYKLKLHNPVEKVGGSTTRLSVGGPLWGSDPSKGANGLLIADGYIPVSGREVSQGNAKSSGWSLGSSIGTEISKYVLPLNLAVEGSYNWSSESSITATSVLDKVVPAGSYTYPAYVAKYNRNIVDFYKYSAAGRERRIIEMPSGPVEFPHRAVQDVYAGSDITWVVVPGTTPNPIYNPNDPGLKLPDPSYNSF